MPGAPLPPGPKLESTTTADWFFGGGETGVILRGLDWASKSIGPTSSWPQSLRTALSLCLESPLPTFVVWGSDQLLFYNDAFQARFSGNHPCALGESYRNASADAWTNAIRALLETVEKTGQASSCADLRFGQWRGDAEGEAYCSFFCTPIRLEDGRVGGFFSTVTQTTNQVEGERQGRPFRDLRDGRDGATALPEPASAPQVTAILDAQSRFEQLVAMMPAGVIACDAQGTMVFFNRRATEIWRSQPVPQQSYAEFAAQFRVLDQNGRPLPVGERHVARALREGVSYQNAESLMERPDGTRFVAQFNISPTYDTAGAITGVIVVFQDVTAERQAAVALQETQERYRAVFQQATVGIFECDLSGTIVRTNPALTRIMGFTCDELIGLNWRDLSHPEELTVDEGMVGRLYRGEVESIKAERRYRRKGGTFGWVDVFATLIRNAAGSASHGLAVVIDITERKQAEGSLRETEARFRVAADNAPVLLWLAQSDSSYTWFNQPWLDFVGATLETQRGDGWTQFLHSDDQARHHQTYHAAFEKRAIFQMEYRLRRCDGRYRWLLEHGVPRYQGNEFVGYIGSCIDIDDRRAAEESMNQSRDAERARRQELEVLTQVAPAGIWITHDPDCRDITGNEAAYAMMRVPYGRNLSLDLPHSDRQGGASGGTRHARGGPDRATRDQRRIGILF